MRSTRTTRAVFAAATVAALAAGCGSGSPETADATPADRESTSGTEFDDLDTGEYIVALTDFDAEPAGDRGRAVESQRLGEFIVHPHVIDPILVHSGINNGVRVPPAPDSPKYDEATADPYGMVSGFTVTRNNPDDSRHLTLTVSRYPSEADAEAAAAAGHEAKIGTGDDLFSADAYAPLTLPEIPDTLASNFWFDTSATHSLSTFTAHGMFVIETSILGSGTTPDEDWAWVADTTARTVQEQQHLLDRFPATPTDDIPDLPIDVDHVLVRAVGFLEDESPRNSDIAVYGPLGWTHYSRNPDVIAELLTATGTDRVAKSNTDVYRAAGGDDALALRDGLVDNTLVVYPDLVENTELAQNLPGATCWSGDSSSGQEARCYLVYDRYVAEVAGRRLTGSADPSTDTFVTVPQRLATQYAKFVLAEEADLGGN